MVAVRRRQQLKILTAVGGAKRAGIEHVYRVDSDRIGEYMRVVPSTLPEAVIRIDAGPMVAAVIGAENAALLRFNRRVDAVAVGSRDRNTNTSEGALREAMPFDLLPVKTTVRGAIEARPRTATRKAP